MRQRFRPSVNFIRSKPRNESRISGSELINAMFGQTLFTQFLFLEFNLLSVYQDSSWEYHSLKESAKWKLWIVWQHVLNITFTWQKSNCMAKYIWTVLRVWILNHWSSSNKSFNYKWTAIERNIMSFSWIQKKLKTQRIRDRRHSLGTVYIKRAYVP